MNASTLVQKLWNYCNVLRDDGMSYGDYVEQLTYLLFLKMADERSQPPYSQPSIIPAAWAWPSLLAKDGDELFDHYRFDKKAASETPWTKKLWISDLRTNQHFTLKTNPLKREDLDEFVRLYDPANRFDRAPTWSTENPEGRWCGYEVSELMARDMASLDIFWLRDETLADSDNLPPPDVIAQEIADDLEAALEQFRLIANDLGESQSQ